MSQISNEIEKDNEIVIPINDSGCDAIEKLQLLIRRIQLITAKRRIRMCIQWDEKTAYYIEPNGTILKSSEGPSGGVLISFDDLQKDE